MYCFRNVVSNVPIRTQLDIYGPGRKASGADIEDQRFSSFDSELTFAQINPMDNKGSLWI